jgi:uncharacterized membrane protein YhaH (DUF805 family)
MLLAYRRPFKFSGRSTRTELLGYLIISWVLSTVAAWGLMFAVPGPEAFVTAVAAIRFLFWLPLPALAVRRAHDIGRPWYWSLALLVPTLLGWVGRDVLEQVPGLLRIMLALNIAGLVILFWKPTDGTNAFGPDPRLDEDRSVLENA